MEVEALPHFTIDTRENIRTHLLRGCLIQLEILCYCRS
jgi:hypothetical protein